MQTVLLFSILLCAVAWLPALGQTPQGTVETEIAVIKTEIKGIVGFGIPML